MRLKSLILLLIGVSLLSINPRINGWNEASRMALTQSVVEQHTLTIDQSEFSKTGDKVYINGHFYSDKPAIPSLLASLVYFPLYHLGQDLSYGWNLAYYLIILLIVKGLWVLSVLAFDRLLKLWGSEGRERMVSTLIFAFATQAFTWSATFNNHSIAASSLMLGFAFYIFGKDSDDHVYPLLSGLFFGLAAASDLPTGLFLIGFALLMIRSPLNLQQKVSFMIAGVIPLGVHLTVNYSIAGTVLPFQFTPEYLQFQGSQWEAGIIVNAPISFLKYLSISFLGPQGFVWYSPLILVLIPILGKHMRATSYLHQETRVIALASALLILTYVLLTQNYGGWGYGIRWFVPIVPLLHIYLFDVKSILRTHFQIKLFWGLVGYSLVIAMIGLINPWSNANLHRIPILANLMQLTEFLSK